MEEKDDLKIKIYKEYEPNTEEAKYNYRVQEKMVNEYNNYIDYLRKQPKDEIIRKAYETTCKNEIVYYFEGKQYDIDECKAMLKSSNLLKEFYDEWLKSDGNFNELLEYSIDNAIEHLVDDYQELQKNKNKSKER